MHSILPDSDQSLLGRAMRYAMFPAGKRIRPLLCIAAYRACQGRSDSEILPFACGIELIHAFSLIQDDLPSMDNDRERRGRPSLHVAFGEANALLTSDAMFSLAFELFAGPGVPAGRRTRAIREIAHATGRQGIVQGQLDDVDPTKLLDARTLRRIHVLKTARLISASLAIGGIAAGAREFTVRHLSRSGTFLGMLFQITDDLLDEEQDSGQGTRGSGPITSHQSSVASRRPLSAPLTYRSFYGRERALFRARRYLAAFRDEIERAKGTLTPRGLRELKEVGSHVLIRER